LRQLVKGNHGDCMLVASDYWVRRSGGPAQTTWRFGYEARIRPWLEHALPGYDWDVYAKSGRIAADVVRRLALAGALGFQTSSVAVRRSAFTRLGGFRQDYRFCEDLDLWVRIADDGGCAHYDMDPVAIYDAFGKDGFVSDRYRGDPAACDEVEARDHLRFVRSLITDLPRSSPLRAFGLSRARHWAGIEATSRRGARAKRG
jgi:hypothetical protein